MNIELENLIKNEKDNIIALRRDFHKHAEKGWLEFRTTAKIAEYLSKLNYEIFMGEEIIDKENLCGRPTEEKINWAIDRAISQNAPKEFIDKTNGYTGVIAILDTKKQGKTTVLRFDIDANEVFESEEKTHRPFTEGFDSINKGEAHCCGHDGHISTGLTVAKILSKIKDDLSGKIILVFQPAEEGVKGASALVNSKLIKNADYFLSGHIGFKALSYSTDIVGVKNFLATKKINIEFIGASAHAGASPEKGKNALLAAAFATISMHTMCQDGRGTSRINVGVLNSGTSSNVIPDKASIKMEVRGETTEICESVYEKCINCIKSASNMYGVDYKTSITGSAPSGESDETLANIIKETINELYPENTVINGYDFGGSEDATYFMNEIAKTGKVHYMMFGSEIKAPHHNPNFDFNEDTLIKAVDIYINTILKLKVL